jgi:hypothetical protein
VNQRYDLHDDLHLLVLRSPGSQETKNPGACASPGFFLEPKW